MTETTRQGVRAPWITAAVLGVIAIALGAVVLFVIHPDRNRREAAAKAVGLTADAQQAASAARTQVLNLTTYSRKSFDSDYARAVAGSTASLKTDIDDPKKKSTLLSGMTKGKFDLQGSVTNTAVEANSGTSWLILVSSQSYQIPDTGSRRLQGNTRFELTMTKIGAKWFASNLQTVGLI
ncbi:MAG: hypothetical protein M3O28_01450, partial [Actinomycetota bacterium]|nr:hypothetical protein [Actinomycetota bacterium]